MDTNSAGNGQNNGHTTPARFVRCRPRIKSTVQAAALQRFAFDAVQAMKTELSKDGVLRVMRDDAMALAQLVRSWDVAANRLRVLKGRGLPASVRSKAPRTPA
jgi:hypothetical protein